MHRTAINPFCRKASFMGLLMPRVNMARVVGMLQ